MSVSQLPETIHSVSTTNICRTDNDFDRPSGTGSLHRYPGTSCLATINLSLRDKSHPPIEAPHNYLSSYAIATQALRAWILSWVSRERSAKVEAPSSKTMQP